MPTSLSAYWNKRNFGATPEPKGKRADAGKARLFVVQKHAARRLHYDFRLELDGTLKSWAIPKGPSLDPSVKRMAVHVEDHPLDYANFEGVIPPKQYGAGTVIVWDRGTWIPGGDPREGYRAGKLKFELRGEKLRGRWTLVRMRRRDDERQESWLLIKERDAEARPASAYDITEALPDSVLPKARARKSALRAARPKKVASRKSPKAARLPAKAQPAKLPLMLSPQLATLVKAPPQGPGWIYEVKFDGYRILARIDGADVKLFTRNGNDWTARIRALADEVRRLGLTSAWLDGEIVVLEDESIPDFQALQRAFDASTTAHIVYFVFDLPYFGGYDLRRVPLIERRQFLETLFAERPSSERLRFSTHFEGNAQQLLAGACDKGLEGLIGKRADAAYVSARSTTWIKLKCTQREEFVIGGYTDPKGGRMGFGALLLGYYDRQGQLRYAGSVGTGFDEKLLATLRAKLAALATDKTPFSALPRDVKGHWVKPKLVAEVAFSEWTDEGRIRHPVFHGLRTDKDSRAVTLEKALPSPASAPKAPPQPTSRATRKRGAASESAGEAPVVGGVKVTHAERVIDAASGATKLDLVRYYDRIAERMLPHLALRPVALVRGPAGVGGELFFQKHADTIRVAGIEELDVKLSHGHPALLIATREALIGAAQMNVIEFHTWNSTTKAIDMPDRIIFDLDPGAGVGWSQVLEAAALMKQLLDLLGLRSFLKTSGGKGLHVVVPITPKWDYDAVKDFSRSAVLHLAKTLPQLFVAKSGASNRVGRIFVDYLRNGRGATTAAAFSARARPGLGVSVPLAWPELKSLQSASAWNILNLFERLAKQRVDPWKDYTKTKQSLSQALKRLGS